MARKKPRTILFRRKSEKKTNYKKRLSLLLAGKPRLVIRFTNSRIIVQLVEFYAQGDKVLLAIDSSLLKKEGWKFSLNNLPAAYLIGLLFAKKAQELKIPEAVLDTGLLVPMKKGKAYALLKGALDGGLNIPHGSDDIFPDSERIEGKHIAKVIEHGKDTGQFTQYLKNSSNPNEIVELFNKIKKKLLEN